MHNDQPRDLESVVVVLRWSLFGCHHIFLNQKSHLKNIGFLKCFTPEQRSLIMSKALTVFDKGISYVNRSTKKQKMSKMDQKLSL